jgi:sec-independent protein translocase protein TatC
MFAAPMCLLFYVGVFASYLLVLKREGGKFPWRIVITIGIITLLILGAVTYLSVTRYGYKLVPNWPFLIR